MATFTALALAEARSIGECFGLEVTGVAGIPVGTTNSSYALSLAGGQRAYLRIYEKTSLATAEQEARMIAHLAERGVSTPPPIPLARGQATRTFVADHEGKPVLALAWIEGTQVRQRDVRPHHTRRIGEALAGLHEAGASWGERIETRYGMRELASRLTRVREQASLPEHVMRALPELERRVAPRVERAAIGAELPVIHGDLFRDNALFQDDALGAILDFENSSTGTAAFDLMVTMHAWCFGDGFDASLVRALVDGYRSRRSLAGVEELHDAAIGAALRFAISRLTDFELWPLGDGIYKDYRRFLARLTAIEALGARGFADLLGL